MKLRTIQANAIVFAAATAILGLAACVQDGRQAAAIPAQAAPANYGLFYTDEGASAKLAYGAPNSDDVGVMMECAKGSGAIDVSDIARTSSAPVMVLASEGRSVHLPATPSDGDGATLLTARTRASTAPLQSFKRSGRIDIAYAGTDYRVAASPAEQIGVRKFFAACERGA